MTQTAKTHDKVAIIGTGNIGRAVAEPVTREDAREKVGVGQI